MAQNNTPLTFTVHREAPELILPAKPTPRELKPLSDIDDQEGLRFQSPFIHFYHKDPKMKNKNPANVIREALAKVLVFYYPFAGRLKEGPARKLMVDCSGQGVFFIEAEADVMLKQFGDALQPPFPCMEELLYAVPGSSGILDSPLLLIQVTRLLCGGFIFAIRINHTMSDTLGLLQFMTALSEMIHGASTPSTLPVWQRELLSARDPPCVTCNHHEYDEVIDTKGTVIETDDVVKQSFFFGPAEISALRKFVPIHLQSCSTFELLITCLWRCRTIALQPDPEDKMRLLCVINSRSKFNPPLPQGYYGNVFCFPAAISTARDLCCKPLAHALELVMMAKSNVTEEYMRSVADLMVIKGRPHYTIAQSYFVSDMTRIGLNKLDFGWGNAAYAGPSKGGAGDLPTGGSYYLPFKTSKGEPGIVVPISLPSVAMTKFVKELNSMLQDKSQILQKHKLITRSKV
ncbi:Chloramphenicol acetyltransferase-like domain-containing protein [Artemisia annua]|uniref:Chloramphenicol acetyltransferase-like domain-containing protein n=1 Tax=Artemisia annua TaxID=35608 RepID=A0A2U1NAP4_ARTAN|nr:Chloramphenicol acetyltransferase-like domain-containing protein [Artemisia annua]